MLMFLFSMIGFVSGQAVGSSGPWHYGMNTAPQNLQCVRTNTNGEAQCPAANRVSCFSPALVCEKYAVLKSHIPGGFQHFAGQFRSPSHNPQMQSESQWSQNAPELMCTLYNKRDTQVNTNDIDRQFATMLNYRKGGNYYQSPVFNHQIGSEWLNYIFGSSWTNYVFGQNGACRAECGCIFNGRVYHSREEWDRVSSFLEHGGEFRRNLESQPLFPASPRTWRQNKIHALPQPSPRRALKRITGRYIACHKDVSGSPDLNFRPTREHRTAAQCAHDCAEYPYFALQNGEQNRGECFCGTTYGAPGYEQVDDRQCLDNEDGEPVGQYLRNAIFTNEDEFRCPIGYLVLPYNLDGAGKLWDSGTHTAQSCANLCTNRMRCSSFEYASAGERKGRCGTFTGGYTNLRNNENRNIWASQEDHHTVWRSCVRIGNWKHCASEHDHCPCNGIVAYGYDESWYALPVKGSVHCSNKVFGDPIEGKGKDCFCDESANWKHCATENKGDCHCNGIVAYGARGSWVTREVQGKVACKNRVFGDPIYGVGKTCQCDEGRVIPEWMKATGSGQLDIDFNVFNPSSWGSLG